MSAIVVSLPSKFLVFPFNLVLIRDTATDLLVPFIESTNDKEPRNERLVIQFLCSFWLLFLVILFLSPKKNLAATVPFAVGSSTLR